MKILFIGGTGRLSSDIAKKSVDIGNEVYLITRGSSQRKKFIDKRYNMIYSDITNISETQEKISELQFDVVIDFLTYNLEDLKRTLKIIENHYKQYIFISTATVYKKSREKEVISENKTEVGNDKWIYAYKKYQCEKYLETYFNNRTEKYTIVRPYVTYNQTRVPYPLAPGNPLHEFSIIKRIKDDKPIVLFDNGMTRTTITNSKDFANGIVGLYLNKNAYNNAFHITSDETVTWRNVIEYIGQYYNKQVLIKDLKINAIVKKYPLYNPILNGDKAHQMVFDSSKIKRVVKNFKCAISLKQGIFETLNFYENNKEFQIIDYLWYGRMDNMCNSKKEKIFPSIKSKVQYMVGYYSLLFNLFTLLKKLKNMVVK